jgi:hypothetical protein
MDAPVNLASPRWVERLFARLQVRYGNAWSRQWAGIDPAAVKADWASVLGALYERNPQALAYGLDNLPDTIPSVTAFLRLCAQAPSETRALPAPVADKALAAEVLGKIAAAIQQHPARSQHTEGAFFVAKMRAITERGGKLTPPQRHVLACCNQMLGNGA